MPKIVHYFIDTAQVTEIEFHDHVNKVCELWGNAHVQVGLENGKLSYHTKQYWVDSHWEKRKREGKLHTKTTKT